MHLINRELLILKAKPTVVDWLKSIPDLEMADATLEEVNSDASVFLVPEGFGEDEAIQYIQKHKTALAKLYFEGWYTDESAWPDLKKKPFSYWFTLEYHSMIVDMVADSDIVKDIDTVL